MEGQNSANAERLLEGLTTEQSDAVISDARRLLVVAPAGSGKTDVMARRIAWLLNRGEATKAGVVAFTFTERAAEEMQFRVRRYIGHITKSDEDATLGDMYVGTIHGFCLKQLRDLAPEQYHNLDVIDEGARMALVQRGFRYMLGMAPLQDTWKPNQYRLSQIRTASSLLESYDIMNEYGELEVELSPGHPPRQPNGEEEWVKGARLLSDVGSSEAASQFARSAARYYAYLRSRRFLDFSTAQSELVRLLDSRDDLRERLRDSVQHLVVDEVQDLNPIQKRVLDCIVGDAGRMTAVGDHRQAIYGWRGGRVEIMADIYNELGSTAGDEVVDLTTNFRSTPRIVDVANRWAATIGPVQGMASPDMQAGRATRADRDPRHVAAISFEGRDEEAQWIAERIDRLVDKSGGDELGAAQDGAGGDRGIGYSDIAILVRSGTSVEEYMTALEVRGITAVYRGTDLYSQPEVLLFLGALGLAVGIEQYYGGWGKSLPNRIDDALGCDPEPGPVVEAAAASLRAAGLELSAQAEERLILAAHLLRGRLFDGQRASKADAKRLSTPELAGFVSRSEEPRRVFPQTIYQWLLAEAEVHHWDNGGSRGEAALFHLGALSSLITGVETPGWSSPSNFKYQMIALFNWGAYNARTEEAPLLVQPDAVTITTIHTAKGLEFAAVFLADVSSQRFPSNFARRLPDYKFEGRVAERIPVEELADNENLDDERRLMYVALTRAERYLFVTSPRPSGFFSEVQALVEESGGETAAVEEVPGEIDLLPTSVSEDARLVTSFSDLRYYWACPHDFYMRKVLGFAPAIDQVFGYGKGLHNLLREVHSDPTAWADLAGDETKLRAEVEELIEQGLFYLRYTTGEPALQMERRAVEIVTDYVTTYRDELAALEFEPEREFETLLEEENVLVSGAIDIVRLEAPPRVSILDFKSGRPDSDNKMKLDEEEMKLQVSLYGVAAKHELEYEPDRGVVRYLGAVEGEASELDVPLDQAALDAARSKVLGAAGSIKARSFRGGPGPPAGGGPTRCLSCDYLRICGMDEAAEARKEA